MMIRKMAGTLSMSFLIAGCAPMGVYQPPASAQLQKFTRDMNGSYDTTWSAVANAAGASFFKIKNFDKGSGLMTLEYEDMRSNIGTYVTCGVMAGRGAPFRTITPEANSVLNYIATELVLSGGANITAKPISDNQTTVQINSQYQLSAYEVIGQTRKLVGTWKFTSREPDTQQVRIPFNGNAAVTCQPSYKLENTLLTEIGAQVSTQVKVSPELTKSDSESDSSIKNHKSKSRRTK